MDSDSDSEQFLEEESESSDEEDGEDYASTGAAGGGDIGVAGSVAVNIVNEDSRAAMAAGSSAALSYLALLAAPAMARWPAQPPSWFFFGSNEAGERPEQLRVLLQVSSFDAVGGLELMVQDLAVQPTDKVLVIGTGSGFTTALLARLARHVLSIERLKPLHDKARLNLADDPVLSRVRLVWGDGRLGHHLPLGE